MKLAFVKMSLRLLSSFLLVLTSGISGELVVDSSGAPTVEESPSPLNVFVNELANFRCVVSEADVVVWRANDFLLDTIDGLEDVHTVVNNGDSSTKEYIISFVVKPSFAVLLNNSDVTCAGVVTKDGIISNRSTGARITIQDSSFLHSSPSVTTDTTVPKTLLETQLMVGIVITLCTCVAAIGCFLCCCFGNKRNTKVQACNIFPCHQKETDDSAELQRADKLADVLKEETDHSSAHFTGKN